MGSMGSMGSRGSSMGSNLQKMREMDTEKIGRKRSGGSMNPLRILILFVICSLILMTIIVCNAWAEIDILKVAVVESSGRWWIVSSTGNVGLMQIGEGALSDYNRHHKTYLTLNDMKRPLASLAVGKWYLEHLGRIIMNEFPEIKDMLLIESYQTIAYHSGIGNLRKWVSRGGRYEDLGPRCKIYLERLDKDKAIKEMK